MTTLANWLKRLDAEKILLVEIDSAGTPIYIADTAYVTEPADAPANQPYSPVVAPDGIPRLTRRIQEIWGGQSVASWGPLVLATQFVGANDLASMALRGKTLNVLMTGPRANVPRSEAATILTGIIGPRSGNADGGLTIEVADKQSLWDSIQLPANQYDGTETANFPAANIGTSKPLALGKCRNVPAILIDTTSWTYQVHDGSVDQMQAIDAVYDNGVSVAFTPNLVAGTFVLSASPAGVITADVQGIKEGGTTYHSTTSAILDWLARTYGGLTAPDIDITGLPSGTVGMYLNTTTTLAAVITQFMQAVIGWWGFGRTGVMIARIFAAPVGGGAVFDQTKHLSDLTWTEPDNIVWSVPLTYYRNWTQINPAGSVSIDTAAWMRSTSYSSRIENASIQITYATAIVANTIDTYFDAKTDADAVGTRALALFGTLRRHGKVTVPMNNQMPELGDEITLADADVMTGDHIIITITDITAGDLPMHELEVWG